MEPQVPLRNKPQLQSLLLLLLLTNCTSTPTEIYEGDDYVTKDRGVYYYDGVPYTGILVEADDMDHVLGEYTLRDGVRNGISKQYWINGKCKREAYYENGIYHGTVKTWYENGAPFESFNYVNGHESGLQQVWKSDGRIKANYEVINGRKYGLTGVKNCINVLEEADHTF